MGFIVDGCSIALGGLLGGFLQKRVNTKNFSALSIGIMLISVVGLLENILSISDGRIVGEHTVVVTVALIAGFTIGNALKLEERICSLSKSKHTKHSGLIDSVLFFGIGGLQISGPILYAIEGDSFQLILKGIIDFPFALMLGATYGKKVSLSAFIVVMIQLMIAIPAALLGNFINDNLLCQLCSLGYVILFFSGFNMICPPQGKIQNINIIPGILLIIIYNVLMEVFLL